MEGNEWSSKAYNCGSDFNRFTIKLWEYFSSAATGVCQLYKGSLNSIDSAWHCGKSRGSHMLRLHLRDLAYENMVTVNDSNGSEVYVPLHVFFGNGISQNSLTTVRKRNRHRTHCSHRSKRIALNGGEHKSKHRKVLKLEHVLPEVDQSLNSFVYNSRKLRAMSESSNIGVITNYDNIEPITVDAVLSNETHFSLKRRYQQQIVDTISTDNFSTFEDAIHLTTLLDPLSKCSVTSSSSCDLSENYSKRSRLDVLSNTSSIGSNFNSDV